MDCETCKDTNCRQCRYSDLQDIDLRQARHSSLLATTREGMLDLVSSTEGKSVTVLIDVDGYILYAEGNSAGKYIGRSWGNLSCSQNAFLEARKTGQGSVKTCLDECPSKTKHRYNLAVPIYNEGKVIAYLGLRMGSQNQPKPFLKFLEHVVKKVQWELAIGKAYAQLAATHNYLSILTELALSSPKVSALPNQEILRKVVQQLAAIAGMKSAVIMRSDGAGETLEALVSIGDNRESIPLSFLECPLVQAFTECRTIIGTPDPERNSQCCRGYSTLIAAPFMIKGKIGGVVGAYQKERVHLDQEIVDVFQAASGLVGQVLENSVLREQANRNQDRLVNILEQMDQAVVLIDPDGVIVRQNAAFSQWFKNLGSVVGRSVDDLRPFPDTLVGIDYSKFNARALFNQVLKDGKTVSFEFTSERDKASYRLRMEPIYIGDRVDLILVTISDVTEIYNLEMVKAEILATISHELRTPITAIKGYLDLMKMMPSERLKDLQASFLKSMDKEVRTLAAMVEKIVAFNHFRLNKFQLRLESVSLWKVVDECLLPLQRSLDEKKLSLSFQGREKTISYMGDSWGIKEIFRGLLDNAVKYSEKGGEIKVHLGEYDGGVLMIVENSGTGIYPEERKRVFEQFYRGRQASSSGIPGSGLGLYIAKYIVDQHGGEIKVEEAVLKGTKVVVSLPVKGE